MTRQLCKFHPVHSGCSDTTLQAGQRYRSAFNDSRLADRVDKTLDLFSRCRSRRLDDFSVHRKDTVATRRLLGNDKVKFAELIDYCCTSSMEPSSNRQVLVLGDGSSFNLNLGGHGARTAWSRKHGSLSNSKVPGFQFMAGLVIDQHSHGIMGVSDMLLYDSPRDMRSQEKRVNERSARLKLPLHDRESGGWTILANNSMNKLREAQQVTFVFDREADSYENMTYLRQETKGEFIIRQKYNRQATNEAGRKDSVLGLLDGEEWQGVKLKKTRRLNHYSKHKRKKRIRKKRTSKLKIRFIKVSLSTPGDYYKHHPDRCEMQAPLYLVEVKEDPSTVPGSEKPICWRLWTTWPVESAEDAWKVVDAYRARWHVEQFFRLLKTDGMGLEKSQLNHPDSIKRLLVMSAKVSAEALKLVQARDGHQFVSISEMFSDEEQKLLNKMNSKLSNEDSSVSNLHDTKSLAYATWIIARLGSWSGYASQRPPGPIRIHRGLKRFYETAKWLDVSDEL